MEFMNRGGQARSNNVAATTDHVAGTQGAGPSDNNGKDGMRHPRWTKWTRVGFLVLLFSGTILAIATMLFLAFGKGSYRESTFVNRDQLQAVFINVNGTNGGQVYFGNIQDMTAQYIRLTNVFYIQNQQAADQNSAQAASSYNLVKLGCELHGPEDAMLINRSEVFFWENLKSDSQVAQKVAEFRKQNPDGQKCTAATNQPQQPAANTQTPGTTTSPSTNNGTTTPPANNNTGNGGNN